MHERSRRALSIIGYPTTTTICLDVRQVRPFPDAYLGTCAIWHCCRSYPEEHEMADNKNPNEKQPGEKSEGQYHYNPGNQSGKKAEILVDDAEKKNNPDKSKRD
jgi:hypothetical protein